jgi:mannose-6-phosphate isomerase-like protein (cupin superfamily)
MNDKVKIDSEKRPRHVVQSIHTAPETGGRRAFVTYRDLGIEAATNGRVGGKASVIRAAMSKESGWHKHICDTQLNYILKGWVDMVFEDGSEVRVSAGDVMMIPGGYVHNELRTSDDLEGLEFTIPANIGTVAVDPPAWWAEREAAKKAASEK